MISVQAPRGLDERSRDMSDIQQDNDPRTNAPQDDVEGHIKKVFVTGEDDGDDTEGHIKKVFVTGEDDDEVEGHIKKVMIDDDGDDDEVAGHMKKL
jgi:hypothetical protein